MLMNVVSGFDINVDLGLNIYVYAGSEWMRLCTAVGAEML